MPADLRGAVEAGGAATGTAGGGAVANSGLRLVLATALDVPDPAFGGTALLSTAGGGARGPDEPAAAMGEELWRGPWARRPARRCRCWARALRWRPAWRWTRTATLC